MQTPAIILERPGELGLGSATLRELSSDDVLVDVEWTGISSGTERLLWSGRMPDFPGMGYPLVPGYETVGRVCAQSASASVAAGTRVFVPGSHSYTDVRSLFGGAARRLVVEARRCVVLPDAVAESGTLLALSATAYHAMLGGQEAPDLIVGHGALGRLLARLSLAMGAAAPVVWEREARRRDGATGYPVVDPGDDDRRNYRRIFDVSGSVDVLDTLVQRLAPGGEIVLAGFYEKPIQFAFAPAFMKEARLRIAAQWQPSDLEAVVALVASGRLELGGILTHSVDAGRPSEAYRQAFEDPDCLKMCLDWRSIS
jgi:3-hydroxyethyl bacteriochlorophyllide a dehydrogenase